MNKHGGEMSHLIYQWEVDVYLLDEMMSALLLAIVYKKAWGKRQQQYIHSKNEAQNN